MQECFTPPLPNDFPPPTGGHVSALLQLSCHEAEVELYADSALTILTSRYLYMHLSKLAKLYAVSCINISILYYFCYRIMSVQRMQFLKKKSFASFAREVIATYWQLFCSSRQQQTLLHWQHWTALECPAV